MQKIKQFLLVCAAFIFSSVLIVPSLAYARGGSDNSGSGSSSKEDSSSSETENETEAEHGVEVENHAQDLAEQFKKKAKTENAEIKDKVKEKSSEERQKSCEARKANIEKRLDKKVERAKAHKLKFDGIYAKVKAFHDDNSLNTPDYDTLVAATDAAEADAAAQILALEALNVDIDCTNSTVTESLAAFREAVNSTKTSLKNYRTAIKNLIVAVKQSAEDTQNSESNQ